jgi:hypothetical protein
VVGVWLSVGGLSKDVDGRLEWRKRKVKGLKAGGEGWSQPVPRFQNSSNVILESCSTSIDRKQL